MGKIINAYGGYTPVKIINRSSDTSDMVIVGSTVDCSNISITRIKNVLNETTTAVSALCSSPNVNKWSGFSPIEWYLSGGVLLNRVKIPYSIGSFAGYDHIADAPYILRYSDTLHANLNETIFADIILSEIDWSINTNIIKVGIISRISGVIRGSSYVNLSNRNGGILSISYPLTLGNQGTLTIDNEIVFADTNNNKLANIPNINTFSTIYYPIPIIMNFNNSGNPYQSVNIITEGNFTIIAHSTWIIHHVYRGSVEVTGNNPYFSGDELRLTCDNNSGVSRKGTIELSYGIDIEVNQTGGNPTWSFAVTGMILSSTSATLNVGSTTVPISFYINSGLGNTNVNIWYALYNGTSYVSSWGNSLQRDGRTVNATLTGINGSAIDYGKNYVISVTKIDPNL